MGSGSRFGVSTIGVAIVAAALGALIAMSMTRTASQTAERGRAMDGKPDFSGIWQALNEAHWDLEAHAARAGMVTQSGAHGFSFAEVPAAPVLALGAVGGGAGVGRCRGGRRADSVHP